MPHVLLLSIVVNVRKQLNVNYLNCSEGIFTSKVGDVSTGARALKFKTQLEKIKAQKTYMCDYNYDQTLTLNRKGNSRCLLGTRVVA